MEGGGSTINYNRKRRVSGEWTKLLKGRGCYRLPITEQISHGNKGHRISNIVSGIIIVLYGDKWWEPYLG